MTGRWRSGRGLAQGFGLLALIALPAIAWCQTTSQEYTIGVEDVLQISVWAHPELERTVTVDAQGNIAVQPVGEIKAAGLTPRQLSDRIADRLSAYLRQGATTVTVLVRDYVSQSVYVSGAVARPGRYGAITTPSLVDVINLAGGALVNGDLSRVIVVRRRGPGPHQFTVDVAGALREGTEDKLPALVAGDMIVVPNSVSLVGGAGNDQGVGVLGQVNRPGLYPVEPNEDLWVALALAGGPAPDGNLATIRVLTYDQTAQVVTVNLEETLQRGNKRPYILKPGDIVFVDRKGVSLWGVFSGLLTTTRDVANIVAVIRVLEKNP
jgi:polysaccharide biosynthesis/export protein